MTFYILSHGLFQSKIKKKEQNLDFLYKCYISYWVQYLKYSVLVNTVYYTHGYILWIIINNHYFCDTTNIFYLNQ